MLIADILHSCTDEGIAEAAVASIGGGFAASLRAEADRAALSVGALTSSLVRAFAIDASERDWRRLTAAMAGQDHPVLKGLRLMVEQMLVRRTPPLPNRVSDTIGAAGAAPRPTLACTL